MLFRWSLLKGICGVAHGGKHAVNCIKNEKEFGRKMQI